MSDPSLTTSADYADALIVARRAKNWIFLLLALILLLQIAVFFIARYSTVLESLTTTAPTTRPTASLFLSYVTAAATLFGTILPILLALVLLLIVNVMLVGRLIGLSRVTSAFVWCLLLALLLFPWQAFFGGTNDAMDFRLPGLIYTWDELIMHANFETADLKLATLKWARFLVFPLLALVLLMIVQAKSNRGLRQALGEATPDRIS